MNRAPTLLLAAALALPSVVLAQVRFAPGELLGAEGAYAVASGDFDGDGRQDLAVMDDQKQLLLQLQQSVGQFTASAVAVQAFDASPFGDAPMFSSGDFNEDGRDDLVFAGPGGWRMLLSQPGGAWSLVQPPANAHWGAAAPLVVDLDRDGHLDLVQAQQLESYPDSGHLVGSALHLYFGNGRGDLQARGVLDAGRDYFLGVVAGHFNADPFVDIATAEGGEYSGQPVNIVLRYGYGGSAFSAPVRLPDHAMALAAGDFNGDGRMDLVSAGLGGPDQVKLRQYLQLPGGVMDSPRPLPFAGTVRTLRALDADGNGKDDLVAITDGVGAAFHSSWLIAWQQVEGRLGPPEVGTVSRSQQMYPDGRMLATGDFDGDGRQDLAEATNPGVQLHLARPRVPGTVGMVPQAPVITSVQAEEGQSTVTLQVARPASDGGSPILGYRVLTTPAGPFVAPVTPPAGTAPFPIEVDLAMGTTYQVQVQAFNAVGDGPASSPVSVAAEPWRQLRIADPLFLPEGDAGPVVHQVPVRLNWPAGPGGVRFDVESATGSSTDAEPGVHFEPVSLQDVFIAEDQSETTIPVVIIGNTDEDSNRDFMLRLLNVRGANGSGLASRVIIQTEEFAPGLPWLYGLTGEVVEGNSGQQLVPVRMAFDRPIEAPVVVGVRTNDIPDSLDFPAVPPADYDATPIPNFTLPAGTTAATIHIPVNGDTVQEPDEFMMILFFVVSGPALVAPNGDNYAVTIIWDNDRTHPPLRARADRIVTSQNTPVQFSVIENDVFTEGRAQVPQVPFTEPTLGELYFIYNDFNVAGDEALVFRPAPGLVGHYRHPYRLCEMPFYSRRCSVSEIEFVVRPIPEQLVALEVASPAGHRDIRIDGLQAMPGARFEATGLVRPTVFEAVLGPDPDPVSPWDTTAGTAVSVQSLPRPADGQPRHWRVLADAHTAEAGEVDLYLGLDANGNGRADPGEVQCSATRVPSGESCELDIPQSGSAPVSYWVMLHNRGQASLPARADIAAVRVDTGSDGNLVATGPGHLRGGEHFSMRLAWNDATLLPGERRVGYLRVRTDADDAGGWVPVRLARDEDVATPSAIALENGRVQALALPADGSHRRLFIDVPEGASSLAVQTRSAQEVDLYLVPAGNASSPRIVDAPPTANAAASSLRAGGDEDAVVPVPAAGRWYAVVRNTGNGPASVEVTANILASAPVVRPGSYFNSERGGHGLVLYPAGNQWVGLWYTYFQDGSPTWLYLQGPAPGEDGLWTAPIYRTAWNGSAQHVVQVGEATATPTGPDAFRFTWTLDGETGSEPMASLGRGCPTLAGAPLDASSHWFDAARAGTGYSVQLWNNYEMHLSFVYDTQGVPRFLVAEGPGFGGAERVLGLEQLQGFCPLCDRPAAPARRTVGTFMRRFGAGTMQVGIDGLYAPAVPGLWSADDDARPLGGPGTTQGCAP